MDAEQLAKRIDHTILGPAVTAEDVVETVSVANTWGMNVCVPQTHHSLARRTLAQERLVSTVLSFPFGDDTISAKASAAASVSGTADEVDMVANIGALKTGDEELVEEEVRRVCNAFDGPVKVIIETGVLTDKQKATAGEVVSRTDAEYLKTCTGFTEGSATIEDVELLSEYLPVKASGGISSYDEAMAMIDAGAARIGASSGAAVVRDASER